jgi:uncharacterized protein (DUF111 family)
MFEVPEDYEALKALAAEYGVPLHEVYTSYRSPNFGKKAKKVA